VAVSTPDEKKFHTVVWDRELWERIVRVSNERGTKPGTTIRYLTKLGLNRYEGDGLTRETKASA